MENRCGRPVNVRDGCCMEPVLLALLPCKLMRESVLAFSGPELGTKQRFWHCACVCACVSGVYRIRVSTEPSESAKPWMSHLHMDGVNHCKMVGLQPLPPSLSLSLARPLLPSP